MIPNQRAITMSVGFFVSGFQVMSCCTRVFIPSLRSLLGRQMVLLSWNRPSCTVPNNVAIDATPRLVSHLLLPVKWGLRVQPCMDSHCTKSVSNAYAFWWALISTLVAGIFYSIRFRLSGSAAILLFTLSLMLTYSITLGNLGTAYRQRAQLLVFFFIFISAGLRLRELKKMRLQAGHVAEYPTVSGASRPAV